MVNRLLEQDHGHYGGLGYKAQTNGYDIEHVFKHHSPEKQQDQAGPHEQHYVQVGHCVTESSQQGQQGWYGGAVDYNYSQPTQGFSTYFGQVLF